jgi:hypothetical protein
MLSALNPYRNTTQIAPFIPGNAAALPLRGATGMIAAWRTASFSMQHSKASHAGD